jgi:hypothetical protein
VGGNIAVLAKLLSPLQESVVNDAAIMEFFETREELFLRRPEVNANAF